MEVAHIRGSTMPPLAETQATLRRLITAPDGVSEALASAGDPEGASLARLVRGDARLSAHIRLAVYANAYFERILECLESDYPAVRWALGEEWFRDLVTAFLIAHPSRHPSLRFAGARLPGYLANDSRSDPFRRGRPWLPDLARYEWALVDAFDAADADPLPADALRAVDPEAWGSLKFTFQPALQLVALEWPVRRLRDACEAGEAWDSEAEILAEACPTLVWRCDERVLHRTALPVEFAALQLALEGRSFAEICERIAAHVGNEEAPARAAGWLADGQRAGLLAGLTID